MQKKLLTLAVAAAMAAPAAAMAEATLYGKLHVSVDYADVKNADTVLGTNTYGVPYGLYYANPNSINTIGQLNPAGPNTIYLDAQGNPIVAGGEAFKGWGVNGNNWRNLTGGSTAPFVNPPSQSRAQRVGVKGSEDLGNGLKAIYQVEFGLAFGDNNIPGGNNSSINVRNSFVGLAGDWGTALVGRHDTPMKISTGKLDLFSDTMADYNGTVGFNDLRVDNAIAYISPSFSGFSFMGAMVAGGSGTAGFGTNINEDSLAGAYSLAAIYNNGPFYASLAYESLDQDMFMDSNTSLNGKGACYLPDGTRGPSCGYMDDSFDKWRVGLGMLDWNGFTLTAIYENQDNLPGSQAWNTWTVVPDAASGLAPQSVIASYGPKSQDLWQIQAAYAFGNNSVKAMYGSVQRDSQDLFNSTSNVLSINNLKDDLEGDRNTWAVGFDHNFSKRTKAYVLYTAVEDDLNGTPGFEGSEWSGFSLGMIHKF